MARQRRLSGVRRRSRPLGLVAATALWALAPQARALDNPPAWRTDLDAAVREARDRRLPLFFYVPGARENQDRDRDDAQQAALRDPRVALQLRERFIPFRVQRHTEGHEFLRQNRILPGGRLRAAAASHTGEVLRQFDPREMSRPLALRDELVRAFRKYRDDFFTNELKPVLEDAESPPAKVMVALTWIQKHLITTADQSVIKLLDRAAPPSTDAAPAAPASQPAASQPTRAGEKRAPPPRPRKPDDGSARLREKVYETLALLSTDAAAQALVDRAATDPAAAAALGRCQACAAVVIADALNDQYDQRHLVAHAALVKVLALRNAKPDRFWKASNDADRAKEVERLRRLAKSAAEKWHSEYDDMR